MHKYYQLLSIEFCHRYTSIEFYHRYTSGALISNLGENVVAYLRGHLTEWAERGRDAYLISPKSWPDMIIFFNASSARKQRHKLFIDTKS